MFTKEADSAVIATSKELRRDLPSNSTKGEPRLEYRIDVAYATRYDVVALPIPTTSYRSLVPMVLIHNEMQQ